MYFRIDRGWINTCYPRLNYYIRPMVPIRISFDELQLEAELFDCPTTAAIVQSLPFTSRVSTWGDEIYFAISAQAALSSDAVDVVQIGDLAYWPTMPAFCIFFGATPASISDEPRAASAVNIFGRLVNIDREALRSIEGGAEVRVELLDQS